MPKRSSTSASCTSTAGGAPRRRPSLSLVQPGRSRRSQQGKRCPRQGAGPDEPRAGRRGSTSRLRVGAEALRVSGAEVERGKIPRAPRLRVQAAAGMIGRGFLLAPICKAARNVIVLLGGGRQRCCRSTSAGNRGADSASRPSISSCRIATSRTSREYQRVGGALQSPSPLTSTGSRRGKTRTSSGSLPTASPSSSIRVTSSDSARTVLAR